MMKSLLPYEKIKREILVKKESKTSEEYGTYPEKREIQELLKGGVVCINKPRGPTSHQISEFVQKILELGKAGHSGTLDPNVTGVLAVTLEKGTKAVQGLLKAGKEYIAIMHLHKEVPEEEIKKVFERFTGRIKQTPPLKSAVKRAARFRKIYYMELMEIDGKDILFKVGCQAGTYIRKLCHDIGADLGTGAHMAELIRTKVGTFGIDESYSLQDLKDAYHYYTEKGDDKKLMKMIRPIERAVEHLGKVYVPDNVIFSLTHGAKLNAPGISKVETEIQKDDLVAVMTLKGEFICYGEAMMSSKEMVEKQRGIAVNTSKVYMDPDVYPKINTKT